MASEIGSGGDYSTITLWDAALGAGADDEGQCYDEAFDETFTINAGTTPKLTYYAGAAHDGTAGSGARVVWTTDRVGIQFAVTGCSVEHLEFSAGGNEISSGDTFLYHGYLGCDTFRCLIHNIDDSGDAAGIKPDKGTVGNCAIYDIGAGGGWGVGIRIDGDLARDSYAYNCTVRAVDNTGGAALAIRGGNDAQVHVKNCVVTDTTASGTAADYHNFGASADTATNASSDSTAPDPIAGEPVVSSTEFVGGSPYDHHLASGAECADTATNPGTDLGTTPTGVEIDVDLSDRDSLGVTWMLGWHQLLDSGNPLLMQMHYHGG